MRKTGRFLLPVILILFLCCGCGSDQKTEQVSYSGKELTLVLSADPASGSTWNYSISDSDAMAFSGERYENTGSSDGSASTEGFDTFTFTGKAGGEFTLTMTYGDQWEDGVISRTVLIKVITDENGKVTSVESDLK